ncbi:hypothetical protein [Streptomyces aureus]|nr:hypothetical protein [Streptomyces aureus]
MSAFTGATAPALRATAPALRAAMLTLHATAPARRAASCGDNTARGL